VQLAERGVRRALTMRADVRVGVALLAFVAAAALLIPSGPLEIDASWSELMLDLRNAGLDAIALALNAVGHGIVRALTIAGVGVFLLVARRLLELGAFAFVQSVTPSATFVIKSLVDRRRPPGQLVHPSGSSFPSGHVSYAATTATILVLLFAPLAHRRAAWVAAALATTAMAWSRTYLQAHWLSDTVAGAALGAGVALLAYALMDLVSGHRPDPAGGELARPDVPAPVDGDAHQLPVTRQDR